MTRLQKISSELLNSAPSVFRRSLFYRITLDARIIGIVGPKGVGKTNLLLQLAKEKGLSIENMLYVQLDDAQFSVQSMFEFASMFVNRGGKLLVLDNLHKYPSGLDDLKRIEEELPTLRVFFASSSAGDEDGAFYELSRIAALYFLPGLSYREFLAFKYGFSFPVIQFDELLEFNRIPGAEVLHRIHPLQYFDEYLTQGYYPILEDKPILYAKSIMELVNQVLIEDFSAVHRIDYESVIKIRSALVLLANQGPMKPNIEKLASMIGTTRDSLLKFLKYLHQAGLISWLTKGFEDVNYFNKPDRLMLNNPSLISALSIETPSRAAQLEIFLHNQLRLAHQVNLTKTGHYLVDLEYEFELMGKDRANNGKDRNPKRYRISADAESRSGSVIPLWMFGFLY